MAAKTSRRAATADATAALSASGTPAADMTLAAGGASAAPAAPADTKIATAIEAKTATPPVPVLRVTKAAQLRAMLEAPGGASLTSLMAATGWQAHTVRAALSILRKGGAELAREKRDGDTVYYIVGVGADDVPAAPDIAGSQPSVPGDATSDTGVPA